MVSIAKTRKILRRVRKAEQAEARALLQNKPLSVLKAQGKVAYIFALEQINTLIAGYNPLVDQVNDIFKLYGLENEQVNKLKPIDYSVDAIYEDGKIYRTEAPLLRIVLETNKIISFLSDSLALNETTMDKLDSLTDELSKLKDDMPENILTHLSLAKQDLEKGSFLGCSLICGKIIRTSLDKIPGDDINKKIISLDEKGMLREKDGKESMIKANHYARNLMSHDLDIMPGPSEAIVYLGEAMKIAKMSQQYQKANKDSEPKNIPIVDNPK